MARKSRKAAVQALPAEREAVCKTAIYVRLSVEDSHTRTASIETQQLIIRRFLEENPDIFVHDTYIDNGASGTNFHRPGFQRMLSDIESGYVNCVIVKDLSRLGRNAIDTGYYIEQYFRARNIRFISVNENYDTFAPEDAHSGIIIPLRNMVNEAYALDIGRKIKAQQRQLMKDGKFVGSRTPYGYLKAPDDCHRLIIDEYAAPIVRDIFKWASDGDGLNTIAVRLNEAGVQSPSHYKRDIGEISNQKLIGSGKWNTRTVGKILHSEVYTGVLAQGRTKQIDHRQVPASPDEWTVVEGTHEPIITKELFESVQRVLSDTAERHKASDINPYSDNMLKGKIFCACCGGSLHRQRKARKTMDDIYFFHCLSRSRKDKGSCIGVTVREDRLLDALTDMLSKELDVALGTYALTTSEMTKLQAEQDTFKEKLAKHRNEIQRLRKLVKSLYESLSQGLITKEDYFEHKERYESEISRLALEIEQLESGSTAINDRIAKYNALAKEKNSLKKNSSLTKEVIDRLIERVEVGHDKEVYVQYRFKREFENYGEVLTQCRNIG